MFNHHRFTSVLTLCLLLTACGKAVDVNHESDIHDLSASVVSEKHLIASGCRFLKSSDSQPQLKLRCDRPERPSDQHRQILSLVRYDHDLNEALRGQSMNEVTRLIVTAKQIILSTHLNDLPDSPKMKLAYLNIRPRLIDELYLRLSYVAVVANILIDIENEQVRVQTLRDFDRTVLADQLHFIEVEMEKRFTLALPEFSESEKRQIKFYIREIRKQMGDLP